MSDEITGDEKFQSILNLAPMNQIIFAWVEKDGEPWFGANFPLPYTSKDNYSCYTEEISTQLEMISGRIVKDIRGRVTKIEYKYDYMPPNYLAAILFQLRSRMPFYVYYRPDDDPDNLYLNEFVCESFDTPKYSFADWKHRYDEYSEVNDFLEPKWHGIRFTLRQVDPNVQPVLISSEDERR